MSQPDRAIEPPPRRNQPPFLLVAAAALALASAGCGDDAQVLPASCDLDDAARDVACQRACKLDVPPTELCPGAESRACYDECFACDVDGVAWCPAVAP